MTKYKYRCNVSHIDAEDIAVEFVIEADNKQDAEAKGDSIVESWGQEPGLVCVDEA
jgi:ABC-type sugar transport system substrate-binding protein